MDKINKAKLNSYIGQLIDLQSGFLQEIVIKKGEDATILKEILLDRLAQDEEEWKAEAMENKAEELN